jgi:outer membrane protein OmpA-like peptidoglycan-associated protein
MLFETVTTLAITILAAAPAAGPVPLREGLTIVTAVEDVRGDYESIKTIGAVGDAQIEVAYAAEIRAGRRVAALRKVLRADMRSAREYRQEFSHGENRAYPGTTALGPSTDVFHDLNTRGETVWTFQTRTGGGLRKVTGTIRKVGTTKVPVLVNDRRIELEALHARGEFDKETGEFFFLNDPENPLTLRYRLEANKDPQIDKLEKMLGRTFPMRIYALDVVKISFPQDTPAQQIEQELQKDGRAEVYGIYFDFDSASIRSESAPVLKEIADVMTRNPAWTLDVEGHTDNVGTDAHNLDLSRRRAESVKQALTAQYGVDAARLATSGFGASRPKEPNDTVAGRARNRRVELVRK